VISLLYVGFELNRNIEILNSDRNRGLLEAMRSWEQFLINDKELVALYMKGAEEYE